jgi:hypothetical protein
VARAAGLGAGPRLAKDRHRRFGRDAFDHPVNEAVEHDIADAEDTLVSRRFNDLAKAGRLHAALFLGSAGV